MGGYLIQHGLTSARHVVNGFVNETRRNRGDGVERGVMAWMGD
jgi:hypothetical protein